MTSVELLPWIAGGCFLLFSTYVAFKDEPGSKNSWLFPAALSALFLAYSLQAVITEGPLGFWTEHTRKMWGNQIWFDLLLAVGIGWFIVLPRAKALGIRPLPWLLLIICTGCIGFLAMIARVLYLGERASQRAGQPVT